MTRYHYPEGGDTGDKVFTWTLVAFWLALVIGSIIEVSQGHLDPWLGILICCIVVAVFPPYMIWASARWERKSRAKHPERWY